MKNNKIISFQPIEHLLEKARNYVDSLELFLEERDRAIPLLQRAMKHADPELKREIMWILGMFAKQDVAWLLYGILSNKSEDEDVRHDAAIQLSVVGRFLKEPQPLIDRLLEDLRSPDAALRLYATFALGWEGNVQAAIPLIERLYDIDIRVQQTAVNALSNLRDDRILNLFLERLEHGPLEQKRCILFNLWRFYSRQEEVKSVYLKYINDPNPDLRFDALVLLRPVTEVREYLPVYRKCLQDEDPRIRKLALKRLAEEGGDDLLELKEEIKVLLDDPDMEVKRAALEFLKKW